jgi:hypothetical protein
MDIPHQFHQIQVLLADNRLISILKEMAIPTVTLIESHRIPGQQTPHAASQRHLSRFTKEMKVVWQKGPGINLETTLFCKKSQSGKEIVSILIGQENRSFLNASTHDMMEDTRGV